jgi:phage baseplate assembly protein W
MASAREKDLDPDVWIGLSFPLGRSSSGFFPQTQTTLEQVKSNLKNLLLTNKGERLGQPEFGSNLYKTLFENIDSDLTSSVEEEIRGAIGRWLPYVNVENVIVTSPDMMPNRLEIEIKYSITLEPDRNDSLSLSFDLQG